MMGLKAALAAAVAIVSGHQVIGTGVPVPQGILTVWHVCAKVESIGHVLIGKAPMSLTAENWSDAPVPTPTLRLRTSVISRLDPSKDLCLLSSVPGIRTVRTARTLEPNSLVTTGGYPFGLWRASSGVYLGVNRESLAFRGVPGLRCPPPLRGTRGQAKGPSTCSGDFIVGETTLYAAQGASGSPVLNDRGELVGLVQSMNSGHAAGIVVLDQILEFLASNESY